jgi:hypothetical protein
MPVNNILELLVAERDKIDHAIAALQGTARRRGRPPGSKNESKGTRSTHKRRGMSAAARKRQSERMKAYWAARRKSAKKK